MGPATIGEEALAFMTMGEDAEDPETTDTVGFAVVVSTTVMGEGPLAATVVVVVVMGGGWVSAVMPVAEDAVVEADQLICAGVVTCPATTVLPAWLTPERELPWSEKVPPPAELAEPPPPPGAEKLLPPPPGEEKLLPPPPPLEKEGLVLADEKPPPPPLPAEELAAGSKD